MAYFSWNTQFETGITIIDEQHKKLIGFVNQLSDEMGKGKGREVTGPILADLFEYTKDHFTLEEKAFEKYNYTEKVSHKKAHRDLLEQITDLEKRNKNKELVLSIKLLTFLTDWVTQHILIEDMKYVSQLKDKPFNF